MNGRSIRVALGFIVSITAATWFAWGVDWPALGASLVQVHPGWVVVAALILFMEFLLRAVRWKVLLRPLGTRARVGDLFAAQVIGAAVNSLFPLRAGEIAKPLVAARHTGYPVAAVVATSVMERVYDLLGMISVLLVMVAVLPDDTSAEGELVTNLKLYGGAFGIFAAACMGVFFLLATRQQAARGIFAGILRVAPAPVRARFLDLFDGFVAGLGNARDRRGLWQAGLLSVWMWLNGALAIWLLFHAFEMDLPFGAACFVGVAIALTVALPQAPGFIGVFHIAMEKTMVLWGQDTVEAKGFAIIFWAISFLPVTVVGLLAVWREGLDLGALRRAPPADAARAPDPGYPAPPPSEES